MEKTTFDKIVENAITVSMLGIKGKGVALQVRSGDKFVGDVAADAGSLDKMLETMVNGLVD